MKFLKNLFEKLGKQENKGIGKLEFGQMQILELDDGTRLC